MAPPTVLVTGGAGYIGSHTVLEMLNAGYNVICVDNLCNAYSGGASKLPEALSRVQEITGKKVNFYRVDITDREQVRSVFQEVSISEWHVSKSFNGYTYTYVAHCEQNYSILLPYRNCFCYQRIVYSTAEHFRRLPGRLPRSPAHDATSVT